MPPKVRLSLEGRNPQTENLPRVIQFEHPRWIPGLLDATWRVHREALEALVLRHPRVWPSFVAGSRDYHAISAAPNRAGCAAGEHRGDLRGLRALLPGGVRLKEGGTSRATKQLKWRK